MQEHCSIIQEPRSVYVGHITSSSGSANKNIANNIIYNLTDGVLFLNELDVLGCNGTVTVTNTGCRTGVIHLIEQQIKRPLQWVV